jgi:hypothetical protein
MADVDTSTPAGVLVNGAKLVGDFMLPGVSLTVDGDVKAGAAHAAVAIAAGAVLGGLIVPVIWAAAGLNSYSTSVTGKNLAEQFGWGKPA